jgi:hypothetical protein
MKLHIGWYGKPGEGPGTKTHFVRVRDRKPLCGCRVSKDKLFQWCSTIDSEEGPDYMIRRYVECENCKRILSRKEKK